MRNILKFTKFICLFPNKTLSPNRKARVREIIHCIMLNPRFCTYFQEKFFAESPEEFDKFLAEIEKPIKRTIRIKPDKLAPVRENLESDGWILEPTNIDRVFAMDRQEDFDPLERRLGMTHDHLVGNFYIQELAAAHPVNLLADG